MAVAVISQPSSLDSSDVDVHFHFRERRQCRSAQFVHRVVEGLIGDAVERVVDAGAAGDASGRQRNRGTALQAKKQNHSHQGPEKTVESCGFEACRHSNSWVSRAWSAPPVRVVRRRVHAFKMGHPPSISTV